MKLRIKEFKSITFLDEKFFKRTKAEVLDKMNRFIAEEIDIKILNIETMCPEEFDGFEGYRLFYLVHEIKE